MDNMEIMGLGTAVPEHWIAQEDAAAIAAGFQANDGIAGALAKLYRRTGVQRRFSVVLDSSTNGVPATQSFYPLASSAADRGPALRDRMQRYEEAAGVLGCTAARAAFENQELQPADVTHLITVSCTGFSAPGFDVELCRRLGFHSQVARTHLGFMGCHGLLNALRVAHAFTANPQAVVLICAVELCSLHQQYGSRVDHLVSNALFADGAAAILCRQAGTNRERPHVTASRSAILSPETADHMSWQIGDHGFEMSLSAAVPSLIEGELAKFMDEWLAENALCRDLIQHWAIHPGGPRILDAVGNALDLSDDALQPSRHVLQQFGNMSSPTVAFVLDELDVMRAPGTCVMLGFGPGLVIEAALLR